MPWGDNDLKDRYKDTVHVHKAGAGLADHAGAEAALYVDDGAGGVDQILGRTATPHPYDPHPDNIAGSWEFSTYGDANQAALEGAGWTFANCTAAVSSGALWLTSTGGLATAWLAVSLTGDFDFVSCPIAPHRYGDATTDVYTLGGMGVADSGIADVAYFSNVWSVSGLQKIYRQNGTWSVLAGASTNSSVNGTSPWVRVSRISGSVRLTGGPGFPGSRLRDDDVASANYGWCTNTGIADASTLNKVFLCLDTSSSNAGTVCGFRFLRRFQ